MRIQVCPGSLAQGKGGVVMELGDNKVCGHQICYPKAGKLPAGESHLLLSQLIEDGLGSSSSEEKDRIFMRKSDRLLMATRLAEATLWYGWREWLGDTWSVEDIEFYKVGDKFEPFLRVKMVERDNDRASFMYHLGITFLELRLWTRLKNNRASLLERGFAEQRCSENLHVIGPEYHGVVRYCLNFDKGSDNDSSEDEFCAIFYQRVINPLKLLVSSTAN
ncbi:hypothetical protein F5883DRAFT_569251 [Diaporthe sp. PMI_573]|nr:hypothetical protein F5883DRAFT_569251 [Diaporthaceae sp. PMI_573]